MPPPMTAAGACPPPTEPEAPEEVAAPPAQALIMCRLTALLEARLQKAVCAVTAHLETSVERRVREAHDGIAARIEDVAAAHVDRARADLAAAASRSPACLGNEAQFAELEAGRLAVARVRAECEAVQKRQDELEGIVTRIATSTARDSAAARAEAAAELRSLGGGIRLALDRVEAELAMVKRAAEEDRAAMAAGSERVLEMARGELAGELEGLSTWVARELEHVHSRLATPGSSSGALREPPTSRQPRRLSGAPPSAVPLLEPLPPARAVAGNGGDNSPASGGALPAASRPAARASAPAACNCVEDLALEGGCGGLPGAPPAPPCSCVEGLPPDSRAKPPLLQLGDAESTPACTEAVCADSQVGSALAALDDRHSLPTPQLEADDCTGATASGPLPRRSCPPAPYSEGSAVASLAGWLAEPACSPGSQPAPTRDLIRAAARELASAAQGDELWPQQQAEQAKGFSWNSDGDA